MLKKLLLLTLLGTAFAAQAEAAAPSTYRDIARLRAMNQRAQGIRPAADGKSYTTLRGNAIERNSYTKDAPGELLFEWKNDKENRDIADYQFSPDGKLLLLSIGSEPIYRHSYTTDYYLKDADGLRPILTDLSDTRDASFSPDGRTLYFCSAGQKEMPVRYKDVKYSLCSIAFHPEDGTFGDRIDTLISARTLDKSISFPKPSFDGKYLMFTLSDYGNFSIWHKEADLWLLDLKTGTYRNLEEVNSDDTESYHNWSSNSHWFVFSSRRGDGLYPRLYISSVDGQGRIGKPFLLPQQDPYTFYDQLIYSYNVPEFVSAPVQWDKREMAKGLMSKERVKVK